MQVFSERLEELDQVAGAVADLAVRGERRGQLAGDLSGGEQQQLALAMTLLLRPRVLLIDELSLGLAPVVVEQLLGVVGGADAPLSSPIGGLAGPVWTVSGQINRTLTRHETLLGWTRLLSKAPGGHVVVCQPQDDTRALFGGLSAEALKITALGMTVSADAGSVANSAIGMCARSHCRSCAAALSPPSALR